MRDTAASGGISGTEDSIYIRADRFIEDFLPFVHHWKYDEAEWTLNRWLEEGRLDGELTQEQWQQIADWQRKPEVWDRKRSRYVPKAVRRQVFERDGRKCRECAAIEHLALDHIKAFIHGGSHRPTNLRVLCRTCNSRKGAR